MDPGHSRGDQGRSGGRSGSAGRGASGDEAARGRNRPPRPSGRQPRIRPDSGEASREDDAQQLYDSGGGAGSDPAHYELGDIDNRLFSGPVSELYGVSGGDATDTGTGGFPSLSGGPDTGYPGTGSMPSVAPVPRREGEEPMDAGPETDSGLVRPYFRTRGRTKPSYDLAIEALVSTSERGRALDGVRVPEHRSICDLCLDTRSVAEVAALLKLPLGVVRVLVGDVAGLGLVLVHSATTGVGDRPSIEFMERVLSGLRRI